MKLGVLHVCIFLEVPLFRVWGCAMKRPAASTDGGSLRLQRVKLKSSRGWTSASLRMIWLWALAWGMTQLRMKGEEGEISKAAFAKKQTPRTTPPCFFS